jgi:hypothetical protein
MIDWLADARERHRHVSNCRPPGVHACFGLESNDQIAVIVEEVNARERIVRRCVRDERRSVEAHWFSRTREETHELTGCTALRLPPLGERGLRANTTESVSLSFIVRVR